MIKRESAATADKYCFAPPPRTEWLGFVGMLDKWIEAPEFNHTHYLDRHDYAEVFNHIFLMLGRLRKQLLAVRIYDTGAGDDKDEIRVISEHFKFKIRPI